jgi:hypothetical protein
LSDSYVVQGAKLKCSCGDQQSTFQVPMDHQAFINNKAQANIMDNKPMVNIQSFGMCSSLANPVVAAATAANHGRLKKMPCVPATVAPWLGGKMDTLLANFPSLLKSSQVMCMWCGLIKVEDDGQ